MLSFQPVDADCQALIEQSMAAAPKKVRALLGGAVGGMSEVVNLFASTRENRVLPDGDSNRQRSPSEPSERVWSGPARISFAEAVAVARDSGVFINEGSLPVTIGGAATSVSGNLEMYSDHLVFEPHDSWIRRGVQAARIRTDDPIMFGGLLSGQSPPRVLVVTLRPSRSRVVFRLGMASKGLEHIVAGAG